MIFLVIPSGRRDRNERKAGDEMEKRNRWK